MWELDHKGSWALKNWCFWTVVLKKTLESPLECKEIQPVNSKGNQSWIFIGRTDAEAGAPIFRPSNVKNWLIWKDPDAGKDWRQEEKGKTGDEIFGWHHRLYGHESVMPSNHLILCHPLSSCLQSFPATGSFPVSQFFTSGGQSIGASASTLVLPMNIQDWFPLRWTGWISLQSKGLLRVFSNTTVKSINSLVLSFLYTPTLISIHDHWKNHSLD